MELRQLAIILQLFYNLVWGGERLTSELRGLPENLPTSMRRPFHQLENVLNAVTLDIETSCRLHTY